MSPVAHEARYYRASRMAYRAWANSQPQYVIPGVLEEVDATRADGDGCGVSLLERADLHAPFLPAGGALDSNDTAPGRTTPQSKRGRGQKEDSLP